jgi:two-component system CitB family sensor kinase
MLTVSAMIIVLVVSLGWHIGVSIETQIARCALDYAKTIASMQEIRQGLADEVPYGEVQELIESFRIETRYQYIIVMDMNGIQYSYPYESGVGKKYKNGGEEKVLQQGLEDKSIDRNKLISAIRAFAPVYYQGEQVGAVLVGFLTDEVQKVNSTSRWNIEMSLVIGLVAGILVAYLLSINIKKSTFGLEPKEIGLLLTERELVLKSIDQGMIAVDCKGTILIVNEAASKLLHLPEDAVGQSLGLFHQALLAYITTIINNNTNTQDEERRIDQQTRVMIKTCLMRDPNQQIVGAVAKLELFSYARQLAEQITDYQGMIDSLRAQNHEFMNKLHTVSGLIQLEAYQEAIDYIDVLSIKDSQLQKFMTKAIKDQKVAGLLLAKYNRLTEAKIDLQFLPDSYLTGFPEGLESETFCSVLGNLLDNAKDALVDTKHPSIKVFIQSDANGCFMKIENNGPMIEEDVAHHLFEKNFTTKSNGHGVGLYLLKKEIEAVNGEITFMNDKGVSWYVRIPR